MGDEEAPEEDGGLILTGAEFSKQLTDLTKQEKHLIDRLVEMSRTIELVLRDEGKNNLADRLAAALGEIDAVTRAQDSLISANAPVAFGEIMQRLKREV